MQTRRDFLRQLSLTLCGAAAMPYLASCAPASRDNLAAKPNVVLIVSDDQGYGDLNCHGNEIIKTPHMDALYEQSTRFTNFYVCPVCSPTRACMMTGRYNYRTGVWDTWKARTNMHHDEITIADVLRERGYETGIFGKWHLGYNHPMRAMDQGFDEAFTYFGTKSRFDPLMDLNGEKQRGDGYLTDILFDKAIDFIDENKDRSFFAYVPSFLPHDFHNKQVPDDEVAQYEHCPNLSRGDKEVYAMVTRLDKNIGRLLAKLKDLDLERNTVVIFLSDNGPQLTHRVDEPDETHPPRYNCGLRGAKGTIYEGGIRVPCFVRWPGVFEAGRDVDTIAGHIDIMPTILDICRTETPKNRTIDGLSLMPLLAQSDAAWPDRCLFAQFYRTAEPEMWRNCAARSQRYKLINGAELYDIENDPGETTDIAAQHPDIVADLRGKYEKWFQEVTAERGFVAERTTLGSPAQRDLRLKYWNRNAAGWPVNIVHEGPYRFRVTDVQHDLAGDKATICIQAGERIYRQPIDTTVADAVIENVRFDKGPADLRIWIDDMANQRTLPYGDQDPGFRNIYIDCE